MFVYYYCLFRYKLSYQIHTFNRKKLDISWKRHLLDRRRMKIVDSSLSFDEKIKELLKIKKGV